MRLALSGLLMAVAAASVSAEEAAQEPEGLSFTANATLTSDYRFRGQSQTDRDAAVQGGIDLSHPSGFFAGVWASTIDFNDPQQSPAEVDFTAGYSRAFDETNASVWVAYYWYPDSAPADYDYVEVLGSVNRDFGAFALSGEATYSPEYSGKTGEGIGISVGAQVPITIDDIDWLTASANVGQQWIEDNAAYDTPDWFFFDVGLSATWHVFTFDVRYTDTDLTRAQCFGGTELCEGGIVLSATANWDVE